MKDWVNVVPLLYFYNMKTNLKHISKRRRLTPYTLQWSAYALIDERISESHPQNHAVAAFINIKSSSLTRSWSISAKWSWAIDMGIWNRPSKNDYPWEQMSYTCFKVPAITIVEVQIFQYCTTGTPGKQLLLSRTGCRPVNAVKSFTRKVPSSDGRSKRDRGDSKAWSSNGKANFHLGIILRALFRNRNIAWQIHNVRKQGSRHRPLQWCRADTKIKRHHEVSRLAPRGKQFLRMVPSGSCCLVLLDHHTILDLWCGLQREYFRVCG